MKKKASEALARGMSPSAVHAFVSLGKYELDCEIPKPEPTPPPKNKEIVPVQFPVCWGEEYRAAPNAIFRSALFPALSSNEKEKRRFLEKEEIFCVAGIKVTFTGKQFDQSDLDVYLEILNIARNYPMGSVVKFSAYSLLKALGLPTGGSNHARLHSVIVRLRGGTLEIVDHKKRYFGGLIEIGMRDEITMEYEVMINPRFAALFGFDMFSKINIDKRRALGMNNTAKSISGYYATHINPTAHKFETLIGIAGLSNTNKRQTKATIIKAHDAMKAVGILNDYTVIDDTIKVDLNHTESQERAITKAAAKKTAGTRRRKLTRVSDLLPH